MVYVLHVKDGNRKWWVVFDEVNKINGATWETQSQVIERWSDLHGKPGSITRYQGYHRPSEAAMTITDIQTKE